jgi:hypothetical protein
MYSGKIVFVIVKKIADYFLKMNFVFLEKFKFFSNILRQVLRELFFLFFAIGSQKMSALLEDVILNPYEIKNDIMFLLLSTIAFSRLIFPSEFESKFEVGERFFHHLIYVEVINF